MKTNWGKKIALLTTSISFLVLAGFILFAPQQSLAQTCQPGTHPDPSGFGCIPDTISCGVGQHQEGSGCVDDEPWSPDTMSCPAGQHQEGSACVANAPAGSGIAASPQPPAEPQDIDCGGWLSPDLNCVIGRLFYYAIYSTFGFLVWISAMFLDLVIKLSILDFHNWAALPGIRIAWTVLRDTMNITFIFLLLYASISMILGLGKEKGIVKGVVIAGLLINFSFFFTSVIIDASNVLTVQMHEAVRRIGDNIEAGEDNSVVGTPGGITAVFMQGTGIQVAAIKDLNAASFVATLLQQMIFSSITFLILAFVFFAMGFLLLGRFVVLIILLITSPVSVMGGLFPQIAGYSKKWWKTLIDQAVFAPLMMLFLVVTAVVVSNPEFRGRFSAESVPGLVGGVEGLVQYAIVIGLLIVSMVVAKSTAGAASNGAANWAIKKAQGAPGAVLGFLGRNTFGRGARFAGEKYDTAMGRMSQLTFKDAKGVTGVAKFAAGRTIAGIARRTPIDEGIRDTLKTTAASKFGSQESLADREKAALQRQKELGQAVKEANDAQKIKDGLVQTQKDLSAGTYDSTTGAIKDYLETVSRMTDKQIEEMLATGQIDKLKKMAPDLTSKHMDKIMSSDLVSDTVKNEINGARKTGLLDRLNVNPGKSVADVNKEAKKIASGKPHEVAQLPSDVLTNAAVSGHLSANTLAKIATDGKMSDADKSTIRANITAEHARLSAITGRPLTVDEQLKLNTLSASVGWLTSINGLVF
ncbi:MAG: hypothetical protein RLY47_244 [Candidatus Parcubacteria bacterium]|jgi:hypothetical protein